MAKKKNGLMDKQIIASFVLRAGLSTVFLYAAISSALNPSAWVGFIPAFVKAIIPANTFLMMHSALEIFLSIWLLSNIKTFYASLISIVFMATIILFNITALDIVFRDVAILLSAIALAALSYGEK